CTASPLIAMTSSEVPTPTGIASLASSARAGTTRNPPPAPARETASRERTGGRGCRGGSAGRAGQRSGAEGVGQADPAPDNWRGRAQPLLDVEIRTAAGLSGFGDPPPGVVCTS